MELRQLESFLAVAELLHFRRAAMRVHLSQPALSRQIQQLEHELGAPLFQRAPGRVTLTDAGRALQMHATRALEELSAARAAIAQSSGSPHGHLALACFDSASTYLIPEVLARLVARYPRLRLSVATLGTRDALRELREGGVDAAIVTLPIAARELESRPCIASSSSPPLPPRIRWRASAASPIAGAGARAPGHVPGRPEQHATASSTTPSLAPMRAQRGHRARVGPGDQRRRPRRTRSSHPGRDDAQRPSARHGPAGAPPGAARCFATLAWSRA